MKKILLGLVLTVFSLGTQASTSIHSGCSDQSFAYNKMNVTESESSINFRLSGATVFKLFDRWEGLAISEFTIDKSKCRFSDDKLLIFCYNVEEVVVTRSNDRLGEDRDEAKLITVRNLTLDVRFIESANSLGHSGFELATRYKIENSDEFTSNLVLFQGDRQLGCTN